MFPSRDRKEAVLPIGFDVFFQRRALL